jgi:hypothetical protein
MTLILYLVFQPGFFTIRSVPGRSQVLCERIVPAKGLLLGAQRAVHRLLARVVDCVLVSSEIVRP